MATGTLAPSPVQTILDINGVAVSGAKITTYIANSSTLVATYSDVNLTTPNANPIVADSAGRFVAYLAPGSLYKFIVTTAAGAALWTQDYIPSTPSSASSVDISVTFGETVTAGQAVYVSSGDDGKTTGYAYKADSGNAYSSTSNTVGLAPNAVSISAVGIIRVVGSVSGLTSLTAGALYYVGTSGAITATAPGLARLIGQADTTTSIVVSGGATSAGAGVFGGDANTVFGVEMLS